MLNWYMKTAIVKNLSLKKEDRCLVDVKIFIALY